MRRLEGLACSGDLGLKNWVCRLLIYHALLDRLTSNLCRDVFTDSFKEALIEVFPRFTISLLRDPDERVRYMGEDVVINLGEESQYQYFHLIQFGAYVCYHIFVLELKAAFEEAIKNLIPAIVSLLLNDYNLEAGVKISAVRVLKELSEKSKP